MAYTYSKIASVTIGSGGSPSIDFIAIPQNYTDLVVKLSLKTSRTTDYVDDFLITFNSSTTGYTWREIANYNGTPRSDNGASASSIKGNAATASHASQTANTFANSEIYIPNYTGSNNKSVSIDSTTEQNGTQIWQSLGAGLWANSAAITSINLKPDVGPNFTQYSTATLYGIKAEV